MLHLFYFNSILLVVVSLVVSQEIGHLVPVNSANKNVTSSLHLGVNASNNVNIDKISHMGREGVRKEQFFSEGGENHHLPIDNGNTTAALAKPALQTTPEHVHSSSTFDSSTRHPVQARKGVHLNNSTELISPKGIPQNDSLKTVIPLQNVPVESKTANSQILNNATKGTDLSVLKSVTNNSLTTATTRKATVVNSSTVKIPKKKPEKTIGSDELPKPVTLSTNGSIKTPLPTVSTSTKSTHAVSNNSKDEAKSSTPITASVIEEPSDTLLKKKAVSDDQFYKSKYIIPIVIPLFVLPLLVLVGRQAIRRGKEAWRNRHYRRMDFLIDGMYND